MSRDHEVRLGVLARIGILPFLGVIYLYRVTLSPIIGGQCRYEPTCSRYGIQAYKTYGPVRGSAMTIGRILRCHPFSKGGYDPVPIPSDDAGCEDEDLREDRADGLIDDLTIDESNAHESERER